METSMRSIFFRAALALSVIVTSAVQAQNAPARIIRGEIVGVDGANLSVRTKAGETISLHLKDGQTITAVIPAELSDIKPGLFIGAAGMPADDGTIKAME